MPKLNALHNHICRDCEHLEYWDGYFCYCLEMPPEVWKTQLINGMYIPENKEITECIYFTQRKTCIPSDEVKECQYWCTVNHHGNTEDCPLWQLHSKNN